MIIMGTNHINIKDDNINNMKFGDIISDNNKKLVNDVINNNMLNREKQ